MISLFLRNLIFTILQPGLVAGLIPYLLFKWEGKAFWPEVWTISNTVGAVLAVSGFFILMICIRRFATEGQGTLSPLDPTKKLVISGLYKYSRNPMYVGVILLLLGEAVFGRSMVLLFYTGIVFTVFNLFIFLHEERRLKRDFGREYEDYCRKVRRWF